MKHKLRGCVGSAVPHRKITLYYKLFNILSLVMTIMIAATIWQDDKQGLI